MVTRPVPVYIITRLHECNLGSLTSPSAASGLHNQMQLIFVTDIGESYTLDVDPNMEMENIMALLEAEVREQVTQIVSDC